MRATTSHGIHAKDRRAVGYTVWHSALSERVAKESSLKVIWLLDRQSFWINRYDVESSGGCLRINSTTAPTIRPASTIPPATRMSVVRGLLWGGGAAEGAGDSGAGVDVAGSGIGVEAGTCVVSDITGDTGETGD